MNDIDEQRRIESIVWRRRALADAVDGATIRDDGHVVLPGHVHGIKDADDLLRALREVGK